MAAFFQAVPYPPFMKIFSYQSNLTLRQAILKTKIFPAVIVHIAYTINIEGDHIKNNLI
jgi:hypothetical protein